MTQGFEWYSIGSILSIYHVTAIHVGPCRGQLIVYLITRRHGLQGGESKASWHFIISGNDVFNGKGVFESGGLRHT